MMSLENTIDFTEILENNYLNDGPVNNTLSSEYYEQLENIYSAHDTYKYYALHINIQSLPAKFERLKELISTAKDIGIELDFILLCETFLTDAIVNLYNIPGYNMIYKNRIIKSRGGVLIYLLKKYKYNVVEELSIFKEGEFEAVFAEAEYHKNKLMVGEIYRIPNTNANESLSRYETILENLKNYHHPIIMGTDQNFNYLKIEEHGKTKELYNLFMRAGIVPTITKPTRITHNSASLIDNFYIPANEISHAKSGIIINDISDHLPIFIFCGKGKVVQKEKQTFTYRPMNAEAEQNIRNRLNNANWGNIETLPANEGYKLFINKIMEVIEDEAPLKTVTLPSKSISWEPWYTKGFRKSAKTLAKLYKKKLASPDNGQFAVKYTIFRNLFNKL